MLKLFYITNKPEIAKIADSCGVDRIFVDLETVGKQKRQGGMNTVQSHHTLEDVKRVKQVLLRSELLVRSNPIYSGSRDEIDAIVQNGADYIMLPYFKTIDEVAFFIELVRGRSRVVLLVETKEAVEQIDPILNLEGIDEMYIGLNDLHLSYGKKFMFELLADGTVDHLAIKFKQKGIPFGFGGIARLGKGELPAEAVVKEHYRIGSTRAILSRSFCNADLVSNLDEIERLFHSGIQEIRQLEKEAESHARYFEDNRLSVVEAVKHIIE